MSKTDREPVVIPDLSGEALRIDPAEIKLRAPVVEKREKYWIGITPECPYTVITLAGVTFHKKVEPIKEKADGTYERQSRFGEVVNLTGEQIESVKKVAVCKVVRVRRSTKGDVISTELLNSNSKYYNSHPSDQPVGMFVYMVPLADGLVPAAMVTGGGAAPLIRG